MIYDLPGALYQAARAKDTPTAPILSGPRRQKGWKRSGGNLVLGSEELTAPDMNPHRHTLIEDVHALLIGSSFIAVGLTLLKTAGLVTGGVAGVALIISYLTNWPVGTVFLVLNIPFYILAQRKAPAKTLTLDYTGTNPIFLPLKALMNRHYLVALVGFGAILAEVLTVCVSSFSVDGKK